MAASPSRPATQPRGRAPATLHTAHGGVRTPAFVPLATKATVKGLLPEEVAALGYEMVLGNTFHLLLNPGPELIERFGGCRRLHGLGGPGHHRLRRLSGLLDGARHGRRRDQGPRAVATRASGEGAILAIEEEGVRFRSYVDGRERFLSPEGSMAVQAALRSDIALVFDECTPFHVDRDYTARSTERTHRWLERCLSWHAAHERGGVPSRTRAGDGASSSSCTGSCRVACTRTCAAPQRARSPRAAATAWRSAARWEPTKEQMYEVVGYATGELGGAHEALPRHLLGIGEVDDLIAGVELGIDTFDCAMPTRLGRHGTALVPDPADSLAAGPRTRAAGATPRSRCWRAAPAPPARAGSRAPISPTSRAPASSPGCGC